MDKKRTLSDSSGQPSAKQPKGEPLLASPRGADASDTADTASAPSMAEVIPSTTFAAPFVGDDGERSEDWAPVLLRQRNQLAALAQSRTEEARKLKAQQQELRKHVSQLGNDAQLALEHLTAIQEDLTLTLARVNAGGDDVDEDDTSSQVAAAIVSGAHDSAFVNEMLATRTDATRRLLAQVVVILEDLSEGTHAGNGDKGGAAQQQRRTLDELHARLRRTSDEAQRAAARYAQLDGQVKALEQSLEDRESELARRRNQIVRLRMDLGAKGEEATALDRDAPAAPDGKAGAGEHRKPSATSAGEGKSAGAVGAEDDARAGVLDAAAAKELSDAREELNRLHIELQEMQKERGELKAKIEHLERDRDVPTMDAVLNSALYQTMEANLQKLVLQQRSWEAERSSLLSRTDALSSASQESLNVMRQGFQQRVELLEHQLADMSRVVEQAKMARDRALMKYESRKLDAHHEERARDAEKEVSQLRDRTDGLKKSNATLQANLLKTRERMEEAERLLAEGAKITEPDVIERLKRELEDEKANSNDLIDELHSTANILETAETKCTKLEKELTERRAKLARYREDQLKCHQELISIKEENNSVVATLKAEEEQVRSLQALLGSSRRLVTDTQNMVNAKHEEAEKLRVIGEHHDEVAKRAVLSARELMAERDELKRSREAAQARLSQLTVELDQKKFGAKRMEQQIATLERKLQSARDSQVNGAAGGGAFTDNLMREYLKVRNCSVKTELPKEVVLVRCGHLFSRKCVNDLIGTRNRKCPLCGKSFAPEDVKTVYF